MPGYFACPQDDLNLCILCMFEGTFSLDAVHIKVSFTITPSPLSQSVRNISKQKHFKEKKLLKGYIDILVF